MYDATFETHEPVYNIEVDGDHVYRVGKSGVLVHNMSTPNPPCPPANRSECEPEFAMPPTSSSYWLRNKKRPLDNYIDATITAMGYFHYDVRNDPDNGRGCPGTWLFEQAWMHFTQNNVTIHGIRGDWTFGRNLNTINA